MTRVLLVDDKQENLEYLTILLKGNGFDVECAPNGQVALDVGRQHPPNIVISDLLMPVMDGYTLLRHWKEDPVLRDSRFMVYTATYTEPADEKLAMDLGADAFVVKPEEPEGMMAHIHEMLTRPVEVRRGPAEANAIGQAALLAQHNDALIRKLEDRSRRLEAANLELRRQVSEIKSIEQRLRESEGQYLMLLNSTAEGIYGIDRNGLCTFCNPAAARCLGYEDPREIVGKLVHEQHHHSRPDGAPMALQECRVHRSFLDGQAAHSDSEVFFRKDGSRFPVEYWAHPIRRGAQVIGAVVTFLDLSERKSLEAQFLQAQKMDAIGRLAGGVAHDFNNIMQLVMTCSECLAERLAGRPEDLAYTREIRAAGEWGAALTRHLLAFSRQQVVHPTLLDLNVVASDVQMLLRRMIGENITLITAFAREVCAVQADANQIEQVLINLAINARDAMPNGGELFVGTRITEMTPSPDIAGAARRAGRYIVLTIRDTGSGMDPETMSKNLRTVLHDEGSEQGQRARTFDGVRHRDSKRRIHRGGQHACAGKRVPHLPSGGSGAARRVRASVGDEAFEGRYRMHPARGGRGVAAVGHDNGPALSRLHRFAGEQRRRRDCSGRTARPETRLARVRRHSSGPQRSPARRAPAQIASCNEDPVRLRIHKRSHLASRCAAGRNAAARKAVRDLLDARQDSRGAGRSLALIRPNACRAR